MSCPQCQGIERFFDSKQAQADLEDYRRNGPPHQTRLLLDALRSAGVEGRSLLDIGGGIGAIQHELIKAGISAVTDVDASSAYLNAAKEEAGRIGYADRVRYVHGDFVALAEQIEMADVVTLDRVLCCYPDVRALVNLSSARAGRLYGIVYPRYTWWARLAGKVINSLLRLQRTPFRFFTHAPDEVEAVLRENGLRRTFHRNSGFWQVAVYSR